MRLRGLWFLLIGCGVALACGPGVGAQPTASAPVATYSKMMVARTVSVPDLHGKTMQQVQAQVGGLLPGSRSRMFAAIDPQGPADGVVASQSPAANTQVVPGATRLLLTLETPKPSKLSTFLQQLATGLAAQQTAEQQKMVVVPDLRGDSRMLAARYVEAARLRVRFTGDDNGVVAQQYPVAGSSVRPGTLVVVTLALAPVVVPSLYGLSLAEAMQKLKAASLLDGGVSGESGEGSTVVSQSIAPGVQVPPQTAVDVTMRAAPVANVPPPPPPPPAPKIAVPDVAGMTGAKAEAAIAGAGLRIGPWKSPPRWRVRSQAPAAGIEVDAGSQVDVTLAAPTVVVPDLRRDSESSARNSLKAFGLQVRISYALNGNTTAPHIVTEQSPAAGTVVDEGSTVDVTIGYDPPPPSRAKRMWDGLAAAVPLAPWWVWLAVGLPIGGVGMRWIGKGRPPKLPDVERPSPPSAHAVCTLEPSHPVATVRVRANDGQTVRFKITFEDRVGEAQIWTEDEPVVVRKG